MVGKYFINYSSPGVNDIEWRQFYIMAGKSECPIQDIREIRNAPAGSSLSVQPPKVQRTILGLFAEKAMEIRQVLEARFQGYLANTHARLDQ